MTCFSCHLCNVVPNESSQQQRPIMAPCQNYFRLNWFPLWTIVKKVTFGEKKIYSSRHQHVLARASTIIELLESIWHGSIQRGLPALLCTLLPSISYTFKLLYSTGLFKYKVGIFRRQNLNLRGKRTKQIFWHIAVQILTPNSTESNDL